MGLKIDPNQSATEIVTALKSQSLPLILSAAINFATMAWIWIKTWKTDRPNFWSFITSRAWLISAMNIVIPLIGTWGLYFADGDVEKLIDYALAGDWQKFTGVFVMTIFGWIGSLLKKKVAAVK